MSQDSQSIQPPQGTVTLLFTDVQGSTAGWERFANTFGEALQAHDRKLRSAITSHNGYIVKTVGDAFMAAFGSAEDAVRASIQMQRELAVGDDSAAWSAVGGIRVRIGLHTGDPAYRDRDYFGPPVNRAARISDAGHGGMILVSRATLDAAGINLEPPIRLIDHGHHRLKDLGDPEHLFEIRDETLPEPSGDRLRTLEARQHNFPAQATTLVGRQKELAEIHALLSKHQTRMITLTGPGGTGKTRLALQVAVDRVQDFPGGIWLVELAGTYDPLAVPTAIAIALKLELPAGADPNSVVIDYLRSKRTLLVLDNFEQVADAARVVSDLLRACPELVCLVTSRELLRISGETEYPVEPLTVPPPGVPNVNWGSFESVQLFVDRGRIARPDFDLNEENGPIIGEICRRLDGVPLAIELAAARVRGMTPVQILQRMPQLFDLLSSGRRDLPERQRTLRGAIDWSYSLLSDDEKELMAELSVFAGGFSLDAAEEVCMVPGAFDHVFSLRDKSLLKASEVMGESRYYMLSTIHEYATEKLKQYDSMTPVHDRHLEFFLRRSSELSCELVGADAPEAMRNFEVELENIRAAMNWAAQSRLSNALVEFAKDLFAFLRRRGLYAECELRLTLAEDAAREINDEVSLARLLNQRALVAYDRSNVATARPLFIESYEISKRLNDRPRMLVALMNLGNISWTTTQFSEARKEYEEALELAIETKQDRYEAFIREDLGILDSQEGKTESALEHFHASLALHRKVGNQEGLASALYNSSDVFLIREQYDEALRRVLEAQQIYSSLQDQRGLALTAVRAGMVERRRGALSEAKEHLSEGLKTAIAAGNRHPEMFALLEQAKVALIENDIAQAEFLLRKSYGIGAEVGDRKHIGDVIGELVKLRWRQLRNEEAVLFYQVVLSAYEKFGLFSAALIADCDILGIPRPEPAEFADFPSAESLFDPASFANPV